MIEYHIPLDKYTIIYLTSPIVEYCVSNLLLINITSMNIFTHQVLSAFQITCLN